MYGDTAAGVDGDAEERAFQILTSSRRRGMILGGDYGLF
jgi:hypothetical protein